MSEQNLQKQIGQRIALLRKQKGLSQDDLAKNIRMSRSSLAQIELGNRGLDILELRDISICLGFSIDTLISSYFNPVQVLEVQETQATYQAAVREPKPVFEVQKTKQLLLYMLERCAGKPNVGESVLFKLLYFADFNHYEQYETHLTGAQYRKVAYGPVPEQIDALLHQMLEERLLQRIKTEYQGLSQTRYLPLEKANLCSFKASEKEVIDRVVDQLSDWSATALSNYTHKDMPWLATKEGDLIDYELVFYREAPFSVRNYGEESKLTG